MRIVYNRKLTYPEEQTVVSVSRGCGISADTARLLFYRGIDTVDKAKRFLSPGKKHFNSPFLFSGMAEAVKRIELAKAEGHNVLIFGDYDADGICATTVLFKALKEYGISARYVVPERDDGYGLNLEILDRLNGECKTDLLITVDCGISDADKIKRIIATGTDVIVTDHHEPPDILPDCITINPKINGQDYPFTGLCGTGVAYKLAYALLGEKADRYLDFVATATVADSMELTDENRDIVCEGLKLFSEEKIRPCFKYLLGENGKQISSKTLAYGIAPRVNAGGRMGDALTSLRLFLSEDENEMFELAAKLNSYNIARQVECDNIYREAKAAINRFKCGYDPVISVYDENWKTGFVGIVAARLVEDYGRPVIVFAGHDGMLKGSARSIEGINIHDAISAVSDTVAGFGGHAQAAGVSVEKQNFSVFRKRLNEYVSDKYKGMEYSPSVNVEWLVDKPVSCAFAREIDLLEPFGVGNKRPLFSTEITDCSPVALKNGSPHYTFRTNALEMIWFNVGEDALSLRQPVKKTIIFEINRSVFRNKESVKGYVRSALYDYSDLSRLSLYLFENEVRKLRSDTDKGIVVKTATPDDYVSGGYGTVYLVSDPDNLMKYPELGNLPRHLFRLEGNSLCDCIIISPMAVPEGFNRVVYLDKPLTFIGSGEVRVNGLLPGYKAFDAVSTDRQAFAEVYMLLCSLVGKEYGGSAEFYERYKPDCDAYQFIFSAEVFFELGIFYVDGGLLKQNVKVKSTLTNSKVFSKICSIR